MIKEIELNDGVVLLRPYRPEDAELMFNAVQESMAELSPWMQWCHGGYSIEESRIYINDLAEKWENGSWFDFAITDAKSGLYLGGCGINHIVPTEGMANLGYWVRTSQTKRGMATRAAILLAPFAINELKLTRIEIVVDVANHASQRVAEKVGAFREGIQRNRLVVHGKASDAVMFSIIPADLEKVL